jgi:hypothetical protein
MAATLLATIPGGVSTTVVTNAGMVPVYFSGGQEPHSGTPPTPTARCTRPGVDIEAFDVKPLEDSDTL